MFDFLTKFPSVRNLSNSTNKLTEKEITENASAAEQDALNYIEDFAESIVDAITSAVDSVINNIVSTAENLKQQAVDLFAYLENAGDDISSYISNLTNAFNTSEVEAEMSIDSYIDYEMGVDIIKAQNGTVQKNITGTISDMASNLTNVDKRDISRYADVKAKKIQDIKKKCTEKLVDYAKQTSMNKFEMNSDVDMTGIVTDMSVIDCDSVNIKKILVSIDSDE